MRFNLLCVGGKQLPREKKKTQKTLLEKRTKN